MAFVYPDCERKIPPPARFSMAATTGNLEWQVTEFCNARESMEDRFVVVPYLECAGTPHGVALVAVIDGHGGSECAEMLESNIAVRIGKLQDPFDTAQLTQAFLKLDRAILKAGGASSTSGACMVLAVIDLETHRVVIANVGDCRASLVVAGAMSQRFLTSDHKITDFVERKRIVEAGMIVQYPYMMDPETNNMIMVTRAFGDAAFKFPPPGEPQKRAALICDPSFSETTLHQDDILVLMSDGVLESWKADHQLPAPATDHRALHDMLVQRARTARTKDYFTIVTVSDLGAPPAHPQHLAKRQRTDTE
jgi:serine/threonine protein phosphatase PrpC